uniref:Uncharacterized protein n=1 Tax=Rhizophora mucronata TaxID=61149 RepID=A0A2P2QRS2_RHIMU
MKRISPTNSKFGSGSLKFKSSSWNVMNYVVGEKKNTAS